jgi:hypothetical protein
MWATLQSSQAEAADAQAPELRHGALVSCPGPVVGIAALPPGAAAFIMSLSRDGRLPLAAKAAAIRASRSELRACLGAVIEAR